MLHIASHLWVPVLLGFVIYPTRWRRAALLMVATIAVDVDHLLAVPIYDPIRCSLDAHPLHSEPAIAVYAAALLAPLWMDRVKRSAGLGPRAWVVHVIGLGLIIHMALDWSECLRLARRPNAVVQCQGVGSISVELLAKPAILSGPRRCRHRRDKRF